MFRLSSDWMFINLKPASFNEKINSDNFEHYTKIDFRHNTDHKELYIILPGWYTKFAYTSRLRKKIFESGCSYLEYHFPSERLSTNYKSTVKFFRKIKEKVISDMDHLESQYGFTKFNLISASLGTVHASMVANSSPKVNKVILIVPGHSLAEGLWKGILTQHLRKQFEENKVTLKELKEHWKELAPENNIDNLKGKEIYIYLSKTDLMVPYYSGRKLFDLMEKKNLKPKLKENILLGHCGTVLRVYNFPKEFLK